MSSLNEQSGAERDGDLDRLRRRVAELEEACARLKAVLDNAKDAILMSDRNAMPVVFNRAYAATMKTLLDLDMRPGFQPHTLLEPGEQEVWEAFHRRVLGGESFVAEFPYTGPDGTTHNFETAYMPIVEGGEVTGFTEITRDITAHRTAEAAAARAETLLTAVIEQSPVPMVIIAADGTLEVFNSACRHQYGIPEDADIVPGQRLDEFGFEWRMFDTDGREIPFGQGPLTRALKGETTRQVEVRVVRGDGTDGWYLADAVPVYAADGNLIAGFAIYPEITEFKRSEAERRRLEARMLHAQKLESLGILAGGIAHDFNNLLTGVLGNADLAWEALSPGHPVRADLEDIRTAALRAAELAKQMLAYSGRGQFVVKPVDLTALVLEMSELLEASISRKVDLRLDLPPDLPSVLGDATQLRQVVMNLILNAAEAIGEGSGVVRVSADTRDLDRELLRSTYVDDDLPAGTYVSLTVADSGQGMDGATIARIFDPFFTTKFTGRGLGLAALLGVVRGHRGAVDVESEPGSGSVFRVYLPVSAAQEVGSPRDEETASECSSNSGTVLLVDDEPTVLAAASKMLRKLGFEVLVAPDGEQAVESFRRHGDDICVVLLDMTMPRMGGDEAFVALRKLRPDVAVILSSGFSEDEALGRFEGPPPDGFIMKPYRIADLAAKLREVLP